MYLSLEWPLSLSKSTLKCIIQDGCKYTEWNRVVIRYIIPICTLLVFPFALSITFFGLFFRYRCLDYIEVFRVEYTYVRLWMNELHMTFYFYPPSAPRRGLRRGLEFKLCSYVKFRKLPILSNIIWMSWSICYGNYCIYVNLNTSNKYTCMYDFYVRWV